MNEDTLYSIIGRLVVDLQVARATAQQLKQQLDAATKPPEPTPPNAPVQE